MSLDKKEVMAGLIATSILVPMSVKTVSADEATINQRNTEKATITANSVNFRTGPSTSYSSMGKLNKGYVVEYISKQGSWVNVKYNGKVGYVHGDYVSKSNSTPSGNTDNSIKSTKVVNANSVNFRSGPSTSYSSMGKLNKGTEVGFISESNGWSKISYNGKVGYMSSQYISNKNTTSSGNTDNSIKSTKVVNANSVNFRTGPSTSYSSLGKLNKGTEVGFISESNGWSKISYNGKVGYMSSQYLSVKGSSNNSSNDTSGDISSSAKADKVIELAKTLLGKPYVWGAEGPSSFDCSGFTQYVFKNAVGVNIPRVSREQAKFGTLVSKENLQKGDIVAFDTEGSNNGEVTHVAIYMGNNQLIHASSSKKTVLISEMSSYYNSAFVSARRVL